MIDLKNQIENLRNEIVYKLAPVQIGMKKYCFKHSDNLHDQLEQRSSGTYNLSYRENQATTLQAPNLEDHLNQMNKLKPI